MAARAEDAVDLSDIAEMVEWKDAVQGRFYRPMKQTVTMRLDRDVLAWFKARGNGYQTRINNALRQYVISHKTSR